MDEFKTIATEKNIKIVISRSEFIGHGKEVCSPEEARAFINAIKEEHKRATHNCSAYVVGLGKKEEVFADDNGEPSGTAGKPILGAIKSAGLTNVVIVVTRYYGGKKLGVRGLIDAYGGTASQVLEEAGTIIRIKEEKIRLKCTYNKINSILYYIQKYNGNIIESTYEEDISLELSCRSSLKAELKNILQQYCQFIE